ncbi:unnamed protein product [Heligmosomoides polygyrus]|uniref:Reverse transcriptase domain-containing protein n=1 Tax=Heligmosomoides polygyrus TaxID=6339 RepID=A0A183GWE4_HELPZ|nr:unnamed protein product [Heligmosomoides polygyrus]
MSLTNECLMCNVFKWSGEYYMQMRGLAMGQRLAPVLAVAFMFKVENPVLERLPTLYCVTCPVEEGKEYVYEKGIEIINNYPKDETVQVNWMVNKDDGKAVCIIFLARIVA